MREKVGDQFGVSCVMFQEYRNSGFHLCAAGQIRRISEFLPFHPPRQVIGIPAVALIGGGAAIFSAFGYSVGDMAQRFFEPSGGFCFTDASILAIGLALLVDGARRLITDEKVLALVFSLKDGVIKIAKLTAKVIAKTISAIEAIQSTNLSREGYKLIKYAGKHGFSALFV